MTADGHPPADADWQIWTPFSDTSDTDTETETTTMTDDEFITTFERALEEHGELHVTMEEHDAELEVRKGQYDADHRAADAVFTLWKHGQPFDFQYSRIVDWYEPEGLFH